MIFISKILLLAKTNDNIIRTIFTEFTINTMLDGVCFIVI